MKKTLLIALICLLAVPVISQQNADIRQKINGTQVPKLLKLTFQEQYKDVLLIGWYVTHISYWYEDSFNSWYGDWYRPRTIVVFSFAQPAYYEVEFMDEPGEISRAIYSRYGAWYETRTQIKGLPLHIDKVIKDSKYADWKRSAHKEMIEIPGMHGIIYRLRLSKGLKSQIVRIDDQGHIVQIKEEKNQ